MASKYWCDACEAELPILSVIHRRYGTADYKSLCGACSRLMDDAAIEVFKGIKGKRVKSRRGLVSLIREALG